MIYYKDCTFEEAIAAFDCLWREKLIHIPPFDKMPREECEKFKKWAWEVFKYQRRGYE